MKFRFRAGAIHLAISLVMAAAASWVVFQLWYPEPYAAIAGGLSLFVLLVSVDVVLGPLMTLVVANPTKPRSELLRDLSIIGTLQLAAFIYGLHVMAVARPIHLVFEIDRFRLVTAADVEPESLQEAPPELRAPSWRGPQLIAAVKPSDPAEQLRAIELGLAGIDLSMQPRYWRPYAAPLRDVAWHAAKPVTLLLNRYPQARDQLARMAAHEGQPVDALRFLPLVSRHASWVTLLAGPDARVIGHLPYEGFL